MRHQPTAQSGARPGLCMPTAGTHTPTQGAGLLPPTCFPLPLKLCALLHAADKPSCPACPTCPYPPGVQALYKNKILAKSLLLAALVAQVRAACAMHYC